jgi:hypothetical protein
VSEWFLAAYSSAVFWISSQGKISSGKWMGNIADRSTHRTSVDLSSTGLLVRKCTSSTKESWLPFAAVSSTRDSRVKSW